MKKNLVVAWKKCFIIVFVFFLEKGIVALKNVWFYEWQKEYKISRVRASKVQNELDCEYFEDYFNSGSSKQTKDALRRRLKTLLSDHYFSNLVNGKSTFDLEELMNTKRKVIIINVNKHKIYLNHYGYFTRFIIELIQKIAFNRANMPKEVEYLHTVILTNVEVF